MNALQGMLQQLARDPADGLTRAVLADLLDEQGPSPVSLWAVPNWLLRRWVARVPRKDRQGDRRTLNTAADFIEWLGFAEGARLGTISCAGLQCFAAEVEARPEDAADLFGTLPAALQIVHGYTRVGRHRGAVRAILFPLQLGDGLRLDVFRLWFGKHRGEDISTVPTHYLRWLDRQDIKDNLRRAIDKELSSRHHDVPGRTQEQQA